MIVRSCRVGLKLVSRGRSLLATCRCVQGWREDDDVFREREGLKWIDKSGKCFNDVYC